MAHHTPRLGQHFLKHAWAARALARAVAPRPGETFLEIGPGRGVLTRELLALGPVVAIEKDPALAERIRGTFPEELASDRLRLIEGDVRDFDPAPFAPYVLAANIPYYITGEIIRMFLTNEKQPRAMALLVQKEVAQRVISAKESILSISVKSYGTPRIVKTVARAHFSPPPSVDSAILTVENISKNFFTGISEEDFFRVVRAGFASKRKLLANNLATLADKSTVLGALAECDIAPSARAENVSLPKWKKLAQALFSY